MPNRKLRVLLDLSMAACGYCGIAQDVRLLYKGLRSRPELDVTGLIYLPHRLRPVHKFVGPGKLRADRVANQARLLWEFDQAAQDWPSLKALRKFKHLRQVLSTMFGSRPKLDPLEIDLLSDTVWRQLFGMTLSPDDISVVRQGKFLLSDLSDGMVHSRLHLGRRPVKLDTRGYDFLIVEGARPFRISRETKQIVRYHDMIPMVSPDIVTNPRDFARHHRGTRQCYRKAFFVCDSESSRDDLTAIYPGMDDASTTIPCMISASYRPEFNPRMVRSIINTRRSAVAGVCSRPVRSNLRYIMCVSMLAPHKNYIGLIQAFNMLRAKSATNSALAGLKLVIVGSVGWKCDPILAAMHEGVSKGRIIHLERVLADEMRTLYAHAQAFVFPSYSEGFGMPPVEAMQCGTPVVASDIPTHRWVLGDAALYCNPYDTESIANAVERVVASNEMVALREQLIARGHERAKLYSLERCADQWVKLLERMADGRGAADAAQGPAAAEQSWPRAA